MRKKAVLFLVSDLLLAVSGFGLHRLSIRTGFEAGTGLAIPGTPATVGLIVLAVLVCAAAVLGAFGALRGHTACGSYRGAFFGRSPVWILLRLVAALMLLPAGGAALLRAMLNIGGQRLWYAAEAVLALLAALGLGAAALKSGSHTQAKGWERAAVSAPPLYFCLRLVLCYKENAADPVLLHYCWPLLAMAAVSLALYYAAGYAFGAVKTKRTFAGFFIALFFCGVWLGSAAGAEVFLPLSALITLGVLEFRFVDQLIPAEDTKKGVCEHEDGETV